MSAQESAAVLAAELLRGRSVEHVLRLAVGGCRIDVETDDEGLLAKLDRYFHEQRSDDATTPDFRILAVEAPPAELGIDWSVKQPDPGKTKIKEEWIDLPDGRVVRKRLTGMIFVFGGDLHLAFGPCLENDNQVINFVNNRYMQWRLSQGYLLAHAGAVAESGRALALCGRSGAGKSTIALRLVAEGLDFVSNDRLLFKRSGSGVEVHGIPKHPRVNPGTILSNPLLEHMIPPAERERLRGLPHDELRDLEDKYDVLIDEVYGPGRFRMQADLAALVVFNWTGDGPAMSSLIDLGDRIELLPLIAKSPGLFYEPDLEAPTDLGDERYLEVLRDVPVVEITGRQDFDAAQRLCLEALKLRPSALG
ncbi:MAG: HprK-related kinase B [Gemmatimonadota bacterium]